MVVASVSPRSPVRLPLDKHHAARRELLRPLAERLSGWPSRPLSFSPSAMRFTLAGHHIFTLVLLSSVEM